jgi:hypothetical protein
MPNDYWPGEFSEGHIYGVTMQQVLGPDIVMIRLGDWNFGVEHDYYYTDYPKPFDNEAAHVHDNWSPSLVARWVNDEQTVCERIGLATFHDKLYNQETIEKVQRVVHLIRQASWTDFCDFHILSNDTS